MKYVKVNMDIEDINGFGLLSFFRIDGNGNYKTPKVKWGINSYGYPRVEEIESGSMPSICSHAPIGSIEELNLKYLNKVSEEFGCFKWSMPLEHSSTSISVFFEMSIKDAYLWIKKETAGGRRFDEKSMLFIKEVDELMDLPHNANFIDEVVSSLIQDEDYYSS